ncbi:MAG TPA: hypothetical protein VJ508_15820, partial [Saprospiraceae bacterium]|nr:hypothetical protein [Saprospiraceae bacterium]
NTSCILANGNIDLNVFPAGNYTFAWSTGATSEDIGQLAAGQYQVTITDSSQCASIGSFIIGSNTPDPVITEVITPSTCNASNGTIDLTITPSLNNSFLWSNGAVSEDLANLSSGIYSITVTGSNGCTATADYMVPNQNVAITINAITLPVTSCVSANGAIDVTILPAGTYTYLWSNGAGTEDIGTLNTGIYSVTVTDQLGCSSSASFTIDDQTAAPSIANVVTPSTCSQSNGQIDITITPVGVYSFSWSNAATSEDVTNLLSGTYQVTVTGLNGCSASASFTVPDQNSNFVINASVTDNQSCVLSTGAIDLTITPAGSYTFLWSNGLTTEDLIQLSSGIYTVTVTDPFHCSTSDLFTIEDISSAPVMTGIVTPTKCGTPNGAIDITVTPPGGNQFRWSNGASTEDLDNLSSGSYSLTITDLNGCTSSDNFQIAGSSPVVIDIHVDLTQQAQGQFTCNLEINQPLSGIESITWTPQEMMSCQEVLCMEQTFSITQPTQIDVMVTDTNG